MLLPSNLSFMHLALAAIVLAASFKFIQIFLLAYHKSYRSIPGPFLARFTQGWLIKFLWPGDALESYINLHKQYGPIVRVGPKTISLSDPGAIPLVYAAGSGYIKSEAYNTFVLEFEGEYFTSIFSARDTERHRILRKQVAQKYSMPSMRTFEGLVNSCIGIFMHKMEQKAGTVVHLGEWLQWYAFDVIGVITFDRRFGFMEQERDIEKIIEGIDFGMFYSSIVGQVPWLHGWLQGSKTFQELRRWLLPDAPDSLGACMKIIHDSIEEYDRQPIAENKDDRKDFLGFLRQQSAREGQQLPKLDLVGHLMTNLLAGSDTTGIALKAILYYLMHNPRVNTRLRKEIDEANAAGKLSAFVTCDESMALPYLQAVFKEAMRLHPSIPWPLDRVVPAEGGLISGHFLPGGTIVGINPIVIHRNESIYGKDAEVFRPERWLDETDDAEVAKTIENMDRHLLIFGAGARTCIGKNISLLEIGKLIPDLLRRFDIEWAGPAEGWDVKTWFFAKQTNVLAKLIPR